MKQHKCLFLVLLLTIAVSAFASQSSTSFKNLTAEQQHKLDPMLFKLMIDHEQGNETFTNSVVRSGVNGETVHRAFIYTKNPDELVAQGIEVNSVLPNFVTSHITLNDLYKIIDLDHVKYIKADRKEYPANDISRGETGADALHSGFLNNTQYKGDNVIICIIDTGIDWEHADFRDPVDPTKSRILYIWDQTLTPQGGETSPSFTGLNYGVEYTQSQIEDEINGVTSGFVREQDIDGHGTHVAGTAAGNGASYSDINYAGMAPNADIIVVRPGVHDFTISNIVDALNYAGQQAAALGKPMVVNLSMGSQEAGHDGTDEKSQAIDNFSDAGKIVVAAAGNDGDENLHKMGTVNSGSTLDITFTVPSYTARSGQSNDDFWFDIYFEGNVDIDVSMTGPNGAFVNCSANAWEEFNTSDGTIYIWNFVDTDNSDRMMRAIVYDGVSLTPPKPGTWTFRIENKEATAQNFHLWMTDASIGTINKTVVLNGGDNDYSLGNTADECIIVGSYSHRWYWLNSAGSTLWGGYAQYLGDLSGFSSHGPTRDMREKPDIVAPGDKVVSSRSQWVTPSPLYIMTGEKHLATQGTSMASPVVAGCVALLLQQNPNLTNAQVQLLLSDNARLDEYTGASVWDERWGNGKLDVFQTMGDLLSISPQPQNEVLVYDKHDDYTAQIPMGTGTNLYSKMAVRFTPSITGQITGTFLHTSYLDPVSVYSLNGDLQVEIWTSNGYTPVSKLSGTNTVTIPGSHITQYTMHYLNLLDAYAVVQAGQTYQLVVSLTDPDDIIALMAEFNHDPDYRSSIFDGTSWIAGLTYYDLVIRPVVSNGAGGIVPVTMASFTAKYDPENGTVLQWSTESEIRNMGFNVLRATSLEGPWVRINDHLIAGAGTSHKANEYAYTDNSKPTAETVYYKIEQLDTDGVSTHFGPVKVTLKDAIPNEFALKQNYPNPFNANTTVQYDLPEASDLEITIYNVRGEKVRTLYNGEQAAGSHRLVWDGTSDHGNLTATGIYWMRMQAGDFEKTVKMLFAK